MGRFAASVAKQLWAREHLLFYVQLMAIARDPRLTNGKSISLLPPLLDAKEKLEHGDFRKMIEAQLKFTPRAARMLMTTALEYNRISQKGSRASVLPGEKQFPHQRKLFPAARLTKS